MTDQPTSGWRPDGDPAAVPPTQPLDTPSDAADAAPDVAADAAPSEADAAVSASPWTPTNTAGPADIGAAAPGASYSMDGQVLPPEPPVRQVVAKGLGGLLRIGLSVAAVFVFGLISFMIFKPGVAGAKVGDCLVVTGTEAKPVANVAVCTAPQAVFVVTSTDGKCDEHEFEYTISKTGVEVTHLCVFYNVKVGECLVTDEKTKLDIKTECTSGTFKVEAVKDGTSKESDCADDQGALTNVTRNKVLCVSQVP